MKAVFTKKNNMNPVRNFKELCKYCFIPLKKEGEKKRGNCYECEEMAFTKKAKPNCVCCGKKIYSARGLVYRMIHSGNYCSVCNNNAQRLWLLKAGIDCNKNVIWKMEKKLKKKDLSGYEIKEIKFDISEREKAIREKSVDLDKLIKTLPQYFNGKLAPRSKEANSLVE